LIWIRGRETGDWGRFLSRLPSPVIKIMSKPLILTGFMGAGKSAVGRLCAEKLGLRFVDADTEIENRERMSIAQIFETKGEPYFREMERALVAEICGWQDVVVSTGGGMVMNAANRRALLRGGVCVCLGATPEVILKRLGPDAIRQRPMLSGPDPAARVKELLAARAAAYGEMHYQVDTSAIAPEEVAAQVCALFAGERERIAVKHPNGEYDIALGEGVLSAVGAALAGRGWNGPAAIVTDDDVAPLFAEQVAEDLRQRGMSAFAHVIPAGEASKNLRTVEGMYRAFAAHGVERGSAVIALGGGVIGDSAGFAAATYLRGLPFVQIPTSLLAMADSSIGGKVGVDTDFGKNLVGAFKQPDLVLMDLDALDSLPDVEISCGLAEIVKAGIIKGGSFWDEILAAGKDAAQDRLALAKRLLPQAILLKREVVEEDPYEKGRRALLNLGHTYAHALEAWSGFGIKHGLAVSLGMVCAARLSVLAGFCDEDTAGKVIAALQGVGLPTSLREVVTPAPLPALDPSHIWELMQTDKKKKGGKVRFVVLRKPGDVFMTGEVTQEMAEKALHEI